MNFFKKVIAVLFIINIIPCDVYSSDELNTFNFQGKLTGSNGIPISSTVNMTFCIYDNNNINLWSETQSVSIVAGEFSLLLGKTSGNPIGFSVNEQGRYIGLAVGDDEEMNPRQEIGGVLRSGMALSVIDSAITTSKIADSAVISSKIADSTVTSSKIADNAITVTKIPDDSVTAAKIIDGAGSGLNADLLDNKDSNDFYQKNVNMGIGVATPSQNMLQIGGSVSINRSGAEHHAVGGMSIVHGGDTFPERALQISPADSDRHSYIIQTSLNADGTSFWWTYGVNKNGLYVINPGSSGINGTSFVINRSGYIGMGIADPTHRLHVNGVARSTQANWATSSDLRVKKNITPLTGSLKKILKLRPVTFEYIDEYKQDKKAFNKTQMGFIAQEVKEVSPEMVTTTSESFGDTTIEDFHILNTSNLTPMLIDAIKELKAEIDSLKLKISDLESK